MAKIKTLEFFKGELNGVYQKLWIAISENNNLFKTSVLEYFNNVPDIKNTKWKHISNEHYSQINDQMYLFRAIDFELRKTKINRGLEL